MTPARLRPLVGLLALAAGLGPARAQAPGPERPVHVETRAVPGRDVKEVRAEGLVEAPVHVLRAVIADVEGYPAFMPYVKESRLLDRDAAGGLLNYQRLSFGIPLVSDRQYVIRIVERRYRGRAGGLGYVFAWSLADRLPADAPAEVVRVPVDRGYWDLSPHEGSATLTDVRYCVFTDPGGSLPKWLVPLANRDAVPKLFAAIAAAATEPRYAQAPPPPETPAPDGSRPPAGCADPLPSS